MFANNSLVKVNLLASVDKGPPHCRLSVPDEPVGGLLQGLVVDGLDQAADQLNHVEADTLHVCLDNTRALLEHFTLAVFLVLGSASFLSARLSHWFSNTKFSTLWQYRLTSSVQLSSGS